MLLAANTSCHIKSALLTHGAYLLPVEHLIFSVLSFYHIVCSSFLYREATIGTSVRRSSRSAFGRSTGNDVSGHYKRHYFLFSVVYFSLGRSARKKQLI